MLVYVRGSRILTGSPSVTEFVTCPHLQAGAAVTRQSCLGQPPSPSTTKMAGMGWNREADSYKEARMKAAPVGMEYVKAGLGVGWAELNSHIHGCS